jgi:uncharacterized protein YfaP (DUF2135 family)
MSVHDDGDLLNDEDADRLLAELGDALAHEIGDGVIDAAVNAFWIARTDALIAELDEHLGEAQLAGTRGDTATRQHVFRLGTMSVELSIDPVDQWIDGRISADITAARMLDARGVARTLELDGDGRFRAPFAHGPAAVEVALRDGRTVRTRWTIL